MAGPGGNRVVRVAGTVGRVAAVRGWHRCEEGGEERQRETLGATAQGRRGKPEGGAVSLFIDGAELFWRTLV
jgi:hypothetical protein